MQRSNSSLWSSGETPGIFLSKEKIVLIQKTKELTIYINAARAYEVEVNSNLPVHFHGKSHEDQCLLNLPTTGSLSVQSLLKSPLKCVVSHLKKCFVFLSFQGQVKPLSYKRGWWWVFSKLSVLTGSWNSCRVTIRYDVPVRYRAIFGHCTWAVTPAVLKSLSKDSAWCWSD